MLNRNTQYSEWLLPYLEGGLDEARRAQLEARLAVDPALTDEARRLAQTLGGLRGAAMRAPRPENASVPADLWPHLRARLVLDPAPRPRARSWWLAGVGAPAAAALIVAAFWLPGWHPLTPPALAPRPATRPNPVAVSKPVASPKPLTTSPPPSAAPASPVPAPPAVVVPAPSAKQVVSGHPAPSAADEAAVRAARPTPATPRATPFDLPVPARPGPIPPVRRATTAPPVPLVAPTAPGVKAGPPQKARPPQAAADTQVAAAAQVVTPPAPPPTPLKPLPTPALPVPRGAAGLATGAAPKETRKALDGIASLRVKTQPDAAHLIPPGAPANAPEMFAPAAPAGLDSWQATLSAAVRPPHWGENEGDAQATQALMAARESGMLDDLRVRLEARRKQSPHDLVTGRMLAAVYDFGFSSESALRERRRVSGLEGADGEDWYALAQAEERAGNGTAARAAYRHASESPIPPSPFHAAIARGKA